jgi:hypothetical protein
LRGVDDIRVRYSAWMTVPNKPKKLQAMAELIVRPAENVYFSSSSKGGSQIG